MQEAKAQANQKANGEKNDSFFEGIGFKCGLEVHQRLLTSEKLFCGCSAGQDQDSELYTIERYQRAVAGELGSLDRAALFEELKKKKFIYHIFDRKTCLVDIDEEPPKEMNADALSIAISVASALNMHILGRTRAHAQGGCRRKQSNRIPKDNGCRDRWVFRRGGKQDRHPDAFARGGVFWHKGVIRF
jgi:Archaeal Glu-tRNAGln amidotransferase subunit E (contains GAD domain)